MLQRLWNSLFGQPKEETPTLLELLRLHFPNALADVVLDFSREFRNELMLSVDPPEGFNQRVAIEPFANRWLVRTVKAWSGANKFCLWTAQQEDVKQVEIRAEIPDFRIHPFALCGSYLCHAIGKNITFVHLGTTNSTTQVLGFVSPVLTSFHSRYLLAAQEDSLVKVFDTIDDVVIRRRDLEQRLKTVTLLQDYCRLDVVRDFLVLNCPHVVVFDCNFNVVWTQSHEWYEKNRALIVLFANFLVFTKNPFWNNVNDFHLVRLPDGKHWRFQLENNGNDDVAFAVAKDRTAVVAGKREVLSCWDLETENVQSCCLPRGWCVRTICTWIDQNTILVLARTERVQNPELAIFCWNLCDGALLKGKNFAAPDFMQLDVQANGLVLGQGSRLQNESLLVFK